MVKHLIDEKCISPAFEALRKAHLAIHLALPALASSLPILIPLPSGWQHPTFAPGFLRGLSWTIFSFGHSSHWWPQEAIGMWERQQHEPHWPEHTSLTNNAGRKEILDGQLSRNMFGRSDGQLPQAHTLDQSVRLLHPPWAFMAGMYCLSSWVSDMAVELTTTRFCTCDERKTLQHSEQIGWTSAFAHAQGHDRTTGMQT